MKELDRILCQICINTYKGEHGSVIEQLKNSKFIDIGKVEFLIGELDFDQKYLVVAFQGSDGTADWIDNLDAIGTKLPDGSKVHAGFYRQYEEVHDRLNQEIYKYDSMPIIFTGHSLGAALATLAAYFYWYKCYLVTFGSPRVGNSEFVSNFKNKDMILESRRYVNGADTVTMVPTLWMFYRHVPELIKIGQELSWKKILLYIPRKILGNPLDHEPERYLKDI
jgi:triacylglycerol lipase